jgi:hypothetical protein
VLARRLYLSRYLADQGRLVEVRLDNASQHPAMLEVADGGLVSLATA